MFPARIHSYSILSPSGCVLYSTVQSSEAFLVKSHFLPVRSIEYFNKPLNEYETVKKKTVCYSMQLSVWIRSISMDYCILREKTEIGTQKVMFIRG